MKYLYGPVHSRRLGLSLGVSITPYKTCSFDCIYCQLGRTSCRTTLRRSWSDAEEVIAEIWQWFQDHEEESGQLSYVTLAGTGEPTLHSQIGQIILRIKEITAVPVAVITNASLFRLPEVRKMLCSADLIVPSLDAANEELFHKIDRPAEGITLSAIIDGLSAFRKEYRGGIWLEIMLLSGVNDSDAHIRELKKLVDKVQPDKVQLNSPVRAPHDSGVQSVSSTRLEEICADFGGNCEIV